MRMFAQLRQELRERIAKWCPILAGLPEEVISGRENQQNRTVRQILGHLIDSAANNHHRIVRLQYNEHLVFPDYRQDNDRWIVIQAYPQEDWGQMLELWKSYNLHMIHIIGCINPDCLSHTWEDFEGTRETLETVVEGYLWHLNLHLKEIGALINQ